MNIDAPSPVIRAPTVEGCSVVELRDYLLHRGQREMLIELFDHALIEAQEALGMRVIGQFRDLDRADRFVWLRGFADIATRRHRLESFCGGPHRAEVAAYCDDRLAASARWADAVRPRLERLSAEPMRVLRLQPTLQSLLR